MPEVDLLLAGKTAGAGGADSFKERLSAQGGKCWRRKGDAVTFAPSRRGWSAKAEVSPGDSQAHVLTQDKEGVGKGTVAVVCAGDQ